MEDCLLETSEFLIIDIAVVVDVEDAENAQQSFLKLGSKRLRHTVMQGCNRIQDSILSAGHDVAESNVALGRALNAHFCLSELHDARGE